MAAGLVASDPYHTVELSNLRQEQAAAAPTPPGALSKFASRVGAKFGTTAGLTQLQSSATSLQGAYDPTTGNISYGSIGSGVGSAAGFAIGGPAGAAVGGVVGGVGGSLLDWWAGEDERDAAKKQAKEEREMQRRLTEMAFQDRQRQIKIEGEDRAYTLEGRAMETRNAKLAFGEKMTAAINSLETRRRNRRNVGAGSGFSARTQEFGGAF